MAATQVQYDPNIIQVFAEKLYRRADRIIGTYCALGALIGGVGAAVATSGDLTMIVIAAVALTAVGYVLARDKAFALRLQAQQALCQVRIEANTRDPRAVP